MFINHNRPEPPVTIADLNEHVEFPDRVYLNPEVKEMFRALGLIESYGSGMRRAKNSMMKANGSPALVFGPANDTDVLTSVTMRICPEFIETDYRVKGRPGSRVDKIHAHPSMPAQTHDEIKLTEDEVRLIDALAKKSQGTYAQLASELGCSEAKVYRLAKSLRKKRLIERVGSRKNGH